MLRLPFGQCHPLNHHDPVVHPLTDRSNWYPQTMDKEMNTESRSVFGRSTNRREVATHD